MFIGGGKAQDEGQGRAMIRDLVASGKGLAKFREFVKAQGGSTSWIGKRPLTKAPQVFTAVCTDEGYIPRLDGRALGYDGPGPAGRRPHHRHSRTGSRPGTGHQRNHRLNRKESHERNTANSRPEGEKL